MKLAIISDIHDNIPNLENCLTWCRNNKIKTVICCGDVTNNETLSKIDDFFNDGGWLVRGNMEIYDEDETANLHNLKYLGRYGVAEVSGKKFGLCHEPLYIDKVVALCEKSGGCQYIFYGHTHQPWEYIRRNIKVINPGTVAGTFSKSTFAAWDTETGEITLKVIELL